MKKNKNTYLLLPAVFLMLLAMVACEKDDDVATGPKRMFTPSSDIKAVSGEKSVTLTWQPSLYTQEIEETYTVEVAADTLFETPIVYKAETDTSGITITDEHLEVRKPYFARVKANAYGSREASGWVVSSRFMIRGEQIFLPLSSTDVFHDLVILSWRESDGITRIVITPVDATGEPVGEGIATDLEEEDILNGKKSISGLAPETTYRAEIFADKASKGTITFNTIKEPEEGAIDLTSITDRPSVLQDTLLQIDAGSVVVLKKGVTYTIDATVKLDRSVKIMSEINTEPGKAKIYFTSNFDIEGGSNIDFIEFENLEMESDDRSGRYVFNIDNAGTIGKISFDGCDIKEFRGVTRIKTADVTITDFNFNNTVISAVLGYGVVNVDHVGSRVDNIKLTNSTIYQVEKILVSKAASNSILIANSTFNQAPQAERYLVEYNGVDVTSGVEVNNNIFGMAWKSGEKVEVRGVRTGNNLVNASNNYATADYLNMGYPIPDLKSYSGTSSDLFVDPLNGNFTIKDASFEGKDTAGDPTRDRSE